jgi:hypothetical protein
MGCEPNQIQAADGQTLAGGHRKKMGPVPVGDDTQPHRRHEDGAPRGWTHPIGKGLDRNHRPGQQHTEQHKSHRVGNGCRQDIDIPHGPGDMRTVVSGRFMDAGEQIHFTRIAGQFLIEDLLDQEGPEKVHRPDPTVDEHFHGGKRQMQHRNDQVEADMNRHFADHIHQPDVPELIADHADDRHADGPSNQVLESIAHHVCRLKLSHSGRPSNVCARWILLVILSLAGAQGFAQNPVANPDGDFLTPGADRILPNTRQGSQFNETWTYQFHLNDGMHLQVTFSLVGFGSWKSPVSGVRVAIQHPDGRAYHVSREYPLERLVVDTRNNRVRLHPEREFFFEGRLPGAHRIVVRTRKNDVRYDIDLTLHDIVPGRIWGDGRFHVGGRHVGIITHIPYAAVSGHVAVDEDRRTVTGTAYMDHIWQTESDWTEIRGITRFSRQTDAANWHHVLMLTPTRGEGPAVGYVIRSEGGRFRHDGILSSHETGADRVQGWTLARSKRIRLATGSEIRLERITHEDTQATLSELNWIARRTARALMGGELVEFRGRGSLLMNGRRSEGRYTFTIVD